MLKKKIILYGLRQKSMQNRSHSHDESHTESCHIRCHYYKDVFKTLKSMLGLDGDLKRGLTKY